MESLARVLRPYAHVRLLLSALIAVGCANVLGIDDPGPVRADDAGGASGEGNGGHEANGTAGHTLGSAGAGLVASGGEAGEPTVILGGEAGDAAGGASASGGAGGSSGSAGNSGNAGSNGGQSAGGGGSGGVSGGGAAGMAGATGCMTSDAPRCDPSSPKTPQTCNAQGQWVSASPCKDFCDAGQCVDCLATSPNTCSGNSIAKCEAGKWKPITSCTHYCAGGECAIPPSCVDSATGCQQESCCRSLPVPGGTFNRDGNPLYPARVSSFTMDKYEVTVSRLANFVTDLYGTGGGSPSEGAGKARHIPQDPGWKASYSANLPSTQEGMQQLLKCDSGTGPDANATYTNAIRTLPANCVTFYVAYAFCIWDGGRLPTEAEWNYAATGGAKQAYYPWSMSAGDVLIDNTRAVYGGNPIQPVGLKNGAGEFGQMDLAGNVAEWTLDYANAYPPTCVDCLNTTTAVERSLRGGGFASKDTQLRTPLRGSNQSGVLRATIGFRCVHDLN